MYANARNRALDEKPPTSADHQFDRDESARPDPAPDEARQPAADPHREQIGADDGGELQDAVAEQIARQRAGDELIDQPARRDEKDREKENDSMARRAGFNGRRRR